MIARKNNNSCSIIDAFNPLARCRGFFETSIIILVGLTGLIIAVTSIASGFLIVVFLIPSPLTQELVLHFILLIVPLVIYVYGVLNLQRRGGIIALIILDSLYAIVFGLAVFGLFFLVINMLLIFYAIAFVLSLTSSTIFTIHLLRSIVFKDEFDDVTLNIRKTSKNVKTFLIATLVISIPFISILYASIPILITPKSNPNFALNWFGISTDNDTLDFFRDHNWSMSFGVFPSLHQNPSDLALYLDDLRTVLDHNVSVYIIVSAFDADDNRYDFLGIENAYQLSNEYNETREALQNESLWGHPYIKGFVVDAESPLDWIDIVYPLILEGRFNELIRVATSMASTQESLANASSSIDHFLDIVHADGYTVTCWAQAYTVLDYLDGDLDFSLLMHDATLSTQDWDEITLMTYRGALNPSIDFGIDTINVSFIFASSYYVYDYGVRMKSFPIKTTANHSLFLGGMGEKPFDDLNNIIKELAVCRSLGHDRAWMFSLNRFILHGGFGVPEFQAIANSFTDETPFFVTENPITTRADTLIKLAISFVDVFYPYFLPLW